MSLRVRNSIQSIILLELFMAIHRAPSIPAVSDLYNTIASASSGTYTCGHRYDNLQTLIVSILC